MKVAIIFFALLLALSISFPVGQSAKPEDHSIDVGTTESSIRSHENNPPQDQNTPILTAEGGKLITLKDSEMGLPRNALPGAKFITYAQWKDMKEIPKTGLYLVNMTSVPRELPGRLKTEGFTLKQDGTLLDASGKPVAVFTSTQYYQVQADNKVGANPRGLRSSSNSFAASPGSPYAFRCVAASGWNVYDGGFCRDYVARTYADAYGFDERGGCSRLSPHTRIESIETRAEIRGRRDLDTCRDCINASSRARWDIGCWWPAHGGASSFHFVNLFDLGIRFTRSWTWTD